MDTRAQSGEPMICPRCGAKMNHHADKVLYFNQAEEAESKDLTADGSIEEMHACPNCGAGASRSISN